MDLRLGLLDPLGQYALQRKRELSSHEASYLRLSGMNYLCFAKELKNQYISRNARRKEKNKTKKRNALYAALTLDIQKPREMGAYGSSDSLMTGGRRSS